MKGKTILVFLTIHVLATVGAIYLVQLFCQWVAVAKYGDFIKGMAFQFITSFLGTGISYLLCRLLIECVYANRIEAVDKAIKDFTATFFWEGQKKDD